MRLYHVLIALYDKSAYFFIDVFALDEEDALYKASENYIHVLLVVPC